MQQLMWLLALLALPTAAGARGPSGVALVGLTHEYRSNPLGTDALHPRFGWKLVSARRNTMQSAYQIQVARDPIARADGRGNRIWDSGRVPSAASLYQPYGGPHLRSRTRYHWRVRV